MAWRLGKRPALDGVRGIAILLVVADHADVPMLGAAGTVGVTVFFTLSGFLITALLLEEHERSGRIDLRIGGPGPAGGVELDAGARRPSSPMTSETRLTGSSDTMPWEAVPHDEPEGGRVRPLGAGI